MPSMNQPVPFHVDWIGLHDRWGVSLQEEASQLRCGPRPPVTAALNNAVISQAPGRGAKSALQRTFAYRFDRWLARQAGPYVCLSEFALPW